MGVWATQTRALLLKNLALQRRQASTIVVQLLIPTGLVSLIGLVQYLIDKVALEEDPVSPEFFDAFNLSATVPLNQLGEPDIVDITFALPFFYFSASAAIAAAVGQATYNGTRAGLLGNVAQILQREIDFGNLPYYPATYFPFFLYKDSPEAVNDQLVSVYQLWKFLLKDDGLGPAPDPEDNVIIVNETLRWIAQRDYDQLLPYGATLFNDYSRDNARLDYIAMAATRYGGMPLTSNLSVSQYAYPDIDRRGNILNIIHNAMANDLQDDTADPVVIEAYYQGFPQQFSFSVDLASIAGVYLYGFATSLLLPVFITHLAVDKQERVLLMSQMSGMRMSIYWMVAYIYDLVLYMLIIAAIWISSYAFSMRLFTQTSWAFLLVIFALWGHALIGLCFLLSTFFSKARTASVVGYLIVIISVSISNLLNSTSFLTSTPPVWYFLYPPFVFYRAIFLMEDACVDLACFQLQDIFRNAEMELIFWFLLVETLIMFPLTWYLQMVLPNEFGVRRRPLFIFDPVMDYIQPNRSHDKMSEEKKPLLGANDIDDAVRLQMPMPGSPKDTAEAVRALSNDALEDEDVIDERRRVAEDQVPLSAPVLIRQIRKEYPSRYGQAPKVAIHNLSFSINESECFGLLGANGAGKTTLISVLTGVFEPTSGTARLAGHEITEDLGTVQRAIGVCPQFDVFYPDLTTEEHILYYARLKGHTAATEKAILKDTLEQVGLAEQANKAAKNLSGGMRRRLSMAIAIIGNPKIVFLDEPTTGLDPLTRRQIWEILKKLRTGRSVILTTHSMEEADVLCTRIGIMSRGRLKCIGTQERLKGKFGSGYMLTVFAHSRSVDQAMAFVNEHVPHSELIETFAGTLHYRIPKEELVVSSIFRIFTQQRPTYIVDWGLSMATLEDVFVNIAKSDEMMEPQQQRTSNDN